MKRILAILVSLFVLTAAALIMPIPVRALTAASAGVEEIQHYERGVGQAETMRFGGWIDTGLKS